MDQRSGLAVPRDFYTSKLLHDFSGDVQRGISPHNGLIV